MKSIIYSTIVFALLSVAAKASTIRISFWGYDQYAGNSSYYSHYLVTTGNTDEGVASIDLYDRGWGNYTSSIQNSSYHYMSSIENNFNNTGFERSIGWHHYEFVFNDLTKYASMFVDGTMIRTGTYLNQPQKFQFSFHCYYGGIQKTVIDDFEYYLNESLMYKQDFESPTLDSGWAVTQLYAGTYAKSGDPTTTRSGNGSLALGSTTGGNLFSSIAFDLSSVPEPSTGLIAILMFGTVLIRRCRVAA